jgi:hypothetical protein
MPIIGPGRYLLAFELSKRRFELRLLGSERSKPGPNMLNLLGCHAVAINVPDSSLLQAQALIRMRKLITMAVRMSASPGNRRIKFRFKPPKGFDLPSQATDSLSVSLMMAEARRRQA